MIHVLSEEARDVVGDLARRRALLAFDFDGTLAPIVDDPARARIGDRTRALLRAAALLFPCAIISGRGRQDLAARLSGVPLLSLVGNHGAEEGDAPPPGRVRARIAAWAAALSDAAAGEGIEIEDKGFSVAVHYRRAPNRADAQGRILRLASVLPGARVFGGDCVVNLVPAEAPTKADAVEAFAGRWPPAPVLYVGDDETDEDAFRSRVVTHPIRVGRSDRTAARYHVEERREVDDLLWALVTERARVTRLEEGCQDLGPGRKPRGGE